MENDYLDGKIRVKMTGISKKEYNYFRVKTEGLFFFLVLFAFTASPGKVNCQVLLSDNYSENFAFEVKQIDEFFERFNDERTLIKDYIFQHYNQMEVKREDLIKSLFNLQGSNFKKEDVIRFIETVNNSQHPVLLSFDDKDWYARVKCSVLYDQKEEEMFLLLKVQKEKDGRAKWVIQSVYADFFITDEEKDPEVFLNPVSHGVDFIGLDKAFSDSDNLRAFLPSDYQEDQLSKFVLELQNKRISFLQVMEISYHFFQIEGWIITVENYQRQEKNSGWLISNLIPAKAEDKEIYKQQMLKLRI